MILSIVKLIILIIITLLALPFMALGAVGSFVKNSCWNGYMLMELLFDWLFETDFRESKWKKMKRKS